MTLYLCITTTTGGIVQASYQSPTAGSDQSVITTTDQQPAALECLADPAGYRWDGTAIVPLPTWSGAFTGQAVQGVLQGMPIPPTATLTVAGSTFTAAVSSTGTVSFPLTLHPSIADQRVYAQVSAPGTVSGGINCGTSTASDIDLHCVGTEVAPCGPGSLAFLQAWSTAQATPNTPNALQALMLADVTLFTLVQGVLEWAASQPNPLDVSALSPVLDWIQAQVLAHIPSLTDLMPNGTPSLALLQMATQASASTDALTQFLTAATTLPGLE